MLDDVLRWLVQVTGLEPRLLTLTAILMVYSASVYLNAKKGVAGVAPAHAAQPLELCDLASAIDRVESGLETVAKYLINLENRLDEDRLYETFLTPRVPGAPPRSHHSPIPPEAGIHFGEDSPRRHRPEKYPSRQVQGRPQTVREEEAPYFPVPVPITAKSEQPGFFLPLPQAEPYQPEQPDPEPQVQPEPEEPQVQPKPEPAKASPSPVLTETLKRMSRKAGRIP